MGYQMDLLADNADADFGGESYNGKSLMATLGGLGAAQAAADSSHEGYSAWSVALHLAYCKWVVAKALLGEEGKGELGPYPYPQGSGGFCAPPDASPEAWSGLLGYPRRVHLLAIGAIRCAGEPDLEREVAEWKEPLENTVAWLCGHDGYHTAQIRNMGVASFREKRAY